MKHTTTSLVLIETHISSEDDFTLLFGFFLKLSSQLYLRNYKNTQSAAKIFLVDPCLVRNTLFSVSGLITPINHNVIDKIHFLASHPVR